MFSKFSFLPDCNNAHLLFLQEVAYYSIKTVTNLVILVELTFKQGVNGCKVCVKTEQPPIAPLTQQCVEQILKGA